MPTEHSPNVKLEIGHILFIDIVGYSKFSVNEQHGRVDELNGIVRLSEQFQKAEAANRILKIPTNTSWNHFHFHHRMNFPHRVTFRRASPV